MPKTVFEWEGVKMTSSEDMHFALWLQKQDFWLNTFEKPERLKIINDWLNEYRKKNKQ